jgi:hypothetical protein
MSVAATAAAATAALVPNFNIFGARLVVAATATAALSLHLVLLARSVQYTVPSVKVRCSAENATARAHAP